MERNVEKEVKNKDIFDVEPTEFTDKEKENATIIIYNVLAEYLRSHQ